MIQEFIGTLLQSPIATKLASGLVSSVLVFTALAQSPFKFFSSRKTTPLATHQAANHSSGAILGEFDTTNIPDSIQFNLPTNLLDGLTIAKDLTVEGGITGTTATFTGNVTAPNLLTLLNGLTAGSGLSVGTGTRPTITNTGVLSLGGSTGALSLSAGGGISVSGLTISNSDRGSAQNIFKKIAVSGQDTVEVDDNADTLTFIEGTGIDLTTSASGDSITIDGSAAAAFSGWTDDGTVIRLVTATDLVGIGTSAPTQKLDVAGVFVVDTSNSRVGIGTTSPSTALYVAGASTITGALSTGSINNNNGGITNAGPITGASGLTSSGTITFSGLSTGLVFSSSGGVLSSGALSLTSGSTYITGALPTANGGTALTSYTSGDMLYASAANTLSKLGIGSTGQVLTVSGGVPVWASVTGGGGGLCPECLVNNPGSSQSITPSASTAIGLDVRQASSGSVDIFRVSSNGGGTQYFRVDSTGNVILGTSSSSGVFTVSPTSTDPIAISPVAQGAGAFTGTITSADLTAARTWTLPNATGSFCLDTGNCAGVGGNIGGSGTANYLTRWNSQYVLENGSVYDNGSVGIGTTAPASKLSIGGGLGIGTTAVSSLYHKTAVAPDGGLIVEGNVGIGTTTPAYKLDVIGTFNATGATTLGSTLNVTGGTTLSSTLDVTSHITGGGSLKINGTADSWIMGELGIGTSSPEYKIDVSGGPIRVNNSYVSFADGYQTVGYNNVINGILINGYGGVWLGSSSGDTTLSRLVSINSSGNVGIGHTAPTNKLQVANFFAVDSSNSKVGIGTTAPSYTLDVVGNTNLSTGSTYKIAGADVLSGTTLGSGVTSSSLTTVGALASGSITSGFGTISTGNTIGTTSSMSAGSFQATSIRATGALGVFFSADQDFGSTHLGTQNTYSVVLNVQGKAAQTGDLTQWNDVNTVLLAKIDATGNLAVGLSAPSTTALRVGTFFDVDNSNSRIGIGTTAPSATLDFASASTVNLADSQKNALAVETSLFVLDTSRSRVGIGTTNPLGSLHVASGQILAPDGSVTAPGLSFGSGTGFGAYYISSTQWGLAYGGSGLILLGPGGGGNSLNFQTAGSWNSGNTKLTVDNGGVTVHRGATITHDDGGSAVPLIVKGASSQTANLQSWQNSGSTVVAQIDGTGNLAVGLSAPSTTALRVGTFFDVDNSNSRIGIGTTAPSATLDFANASTVNLADSQKNALAFETNLLILDTSRSRVGVGTTDPQGTFDVTNNSISTGKGLNVSSTSTSFSTGSLTNIDWSPGSATTATGDVLTLNVGANGVVGNIFNVKDNGSSVFSVSQSQIVSALPHSFTAAGDVAIAYDLNFTNQTASYIKSNAPLYIEAGESFESNDLTLKTYNSGDLVLDLAGGATFAQGQHWDLATSATALNLDNFFNIDTSNSRIGIGTTAPSATIDFGSAATVNLANSQKNALVFETSLLVLDTSRTRVGIGTTDPGYTLDVKSTGTDIARFNGTNATGCTLSDGGVIACSSDVNLKKNIENLGYGLDAIMKLRPVEFNWRSEGDSTSKSLGFIAQEVERVVPKLVSSDKNGYKELNTVGMVPVLAQAIQELAKKDIALSTEISRISESLSPVSLQANNPPVIANLGEAEGSSEAASSLDPSVVALLQDDIIGINGKVLGLQDDMTGLSDKISSLEGRLASLEEGAAARSAVLDDEGIASASAVLGEADVLLDTEKTNLSSLTVSGDTNVNNLSVTGTLNVGLLSFDGIGTSISAVASPLKLQSEAGSGNLDIFNGKIVMTPDGSVKLNKLAIDESDPESASIGEGVLPDGETKVTIKTTSVTEDSRIFVTPKTILAYPLVITAKKAGESFTVSVKKPEDTDVKFDWWIVN